MLRRIIISFFCVFLTGAVCTELPPVPEDVRQQFEEAARPYRDLSTEERDEFLQQEEDELEINPLEDLRTAAVQQKPLLDAIPSGESASPEDQFSANMMYAFSAYSSAQQFIQHHFGSPDRQRALRVLFFIYCHSVKMYEAYCRERDYPINSQWSSKSQLGGLSVRGAFTAVEVMQTLQSSLLQMFFTLQGAGDISETVNAVGNTLYARFQNAYHLFNGDFDVFPDHFIYNAALEYFIPVIYYRFISTKGHLTNIGQTEEMDNIVIKTAKNASSELFLRPIVSALTYTWSFVPSVIAEPSENVWQLLTGAHSEHSFMAYHIQRLALYYVYLYLTSNKIAYASSAYHITINKISGESLFGFASRFLVGVGSRIVFAQAVINAIRGIVHTFGLTYHVMPLLDTVGSVADFLCITDENSMNSRVAYGVVRMVLPFMPRYFVVAVNQVLSDAEYSDIADNSPAFSHAMEVLGSMSDAQAMVGAMMGMSPYQSESSGGGNAEKIQDIEKALGPEKMDQALGAFIDNLVDSTVLSQEGMLHFLFPYLMRVLGKTL